MQYADSPYSLSFCKLKLTEKFASAQPFHFNEPHCASFANVLKCSSSLLASMELITFKQISRRAIPRHLFGLERSPLFGSSFNETSQNSSGLYVSSSQNFSITLSNT